MYYSYLNPSTGEMERQPPVYHNVNKDYKTKLERLKHLRELRSDIEELLKNGFSPYEDEERAGRYSAKSALEFALSIKKQTLGDTSYKDYENRLSVFKSYLKQKGLLQGDIKEINRKTVNTFLNGILKKSSATNRNNTMRALSALFTVLEDEEIISRNFIKNIKELKTSPKRNKSYSSDKVTDIYEYLEKNDPLMLLFIKFVSYNFLRPIEVCRLQVKDINIKEKILCVRAKNKVVKTKIIPDIMIQELSKLNLSNPDYFLFTPTGIGEWERDEQGKRNYFSQRYWKIKKILGLNEDYTVYSFRHTFISKLYRQLRKSFSKSETYDKLMLITGHSTLDALLKYLRDIDAELPEDYSDLIEMKK
ncbi:site-specific integrase [Sinomicrobium kalidii]|uniref:tyrosine-type recombinase/integrase n=1 Tax=Sinomicrobium kalidii TaxID=2900738 RepID=UPI001E5C2E59|nr:site-specific integrase [Sinomicrobium kalidii]UGU14259.1 site-specific integrase [Sinomicrobium kalidii]